MTRVPVGRSIAHAYAFLFGRFFQIIGIAWLPALVYGVGYYIVLANAQAWVNIGDPASAARTAGFALAALLAATLIHAVIAVSLTQEALGIRKDLTLAHLVIGPRELRLFFGLLLYFLLFAVLYTLVVAACVGLLFVARKYGDGLAPNLALQGRPIVVVGAAAIAFIVLAWFWLSMLRLLFLLAPIASVEHRLRLARAWQLTRGSTLRTFLVFVVVFVPVMIVAWATNRFVLHIDAITGLQPHANPMAVVTRVLEFYSANAGSLALISAGLAVLNAALLAGASAAAYRTVTHHEEAEPEDDTALVAPLLLAEEPHHGGEPLVTPVENRDRHDDHHGHQPVHDGQSERTDHGHHDEDHASSESHGAHGHGDGDAAHGTHGSDPHEEHGDAHTKDHDHGGHEHDSQGHGGDGHGDHGHGGHGHGDDAHGGGDQHADHQGHRHHAASTGEEARAA
jgi:hypothetical protein